MRLLFFSFKHRYRKKELNNFDEAIKCYKLALSIDNNLFVVHNNLGMAYQSLGKFEESKKIINSLINCFKDNFYIEIQRHNDENEKEFEKIRKNTKVNLLANMTEFGKSKLLSVNELEN